MTYLNRFKFPYTTEEHLYPYSILSRKQFMQIDCEPITILYGSNGSGKSTILNIIAHKLGLEMLDQGNDCGLFQGLVDQCDYKLSAQLKKTSSVPDGSKFIRSEDVMHAIVKQRKHNETIKKVMKDKATEMYEHFFHNTPSADPKELVWAKEKYWASIMNQFDESESNGEVAMRYFKDSIEFDCLTLLDEPENSLSPMFQEELAEDILHLVKYFNCQFIIATHSPFLLAIPGAKIYNMDLSLIHI